MEINYQIFKEDIVAFHINHFTETQIYKRSIIKDVITISISIAIVYMLFQKVYYIIIILLTWFVLAMFKKRRMAFLLKRKLNKVFMSEKYKDYFENTKLVTTEVGLQTSTNLSIKTYKWQSIKIISLIDNYIFIITAANDELFIPISAFKDSKYKELFLTNLIEKTNLKVSYTYPINTKK